MSQHLIQRKRRGDSFWTTFWKGGEPVEQNTDERSPQLIDLPRKPGRVFRASIWGMSFPWPLIASTVLGVWLMFAPAIFGVGIETLAANACHLIGALIVVVSVIAMGEVVKAVRYINVLLGLSITITFWFIIDTNVILTLLIIITGL